MSLLDVHDAVAAAVDARASAPEPKPTSSRRKSTLVVKKTTKLEEWNGFKKDEMVRVRDESGARFRFVSYVPEGVDGSAKPFVEVFGGRRGKEKMRYINPERILKLKVTRSRARKAS